MSFHGDHCDILVIGSGNAGFSAAIAAKQTNSSANVLLIDKCPEDWAGGNSYFTAGAFRTAHSGLEDLLPLVNNVSPNLANIIDLPPYSPQDFEGDLKRVTNGRCNSDLGKALVNDSRETIGWLKDLGIRFQLSFNRQAYEVNGRWKFWGGLHLKTQDGGKGLIQDHLAAAKRYGIQICFGTAATGIVLNECSSVKGVEIVRGGERMVVRCKAVVLAAGGFEANPRMRSQYLGPNWDLAHVRGTPYNTGDLLSIVMAPPINAKQAGNWSGCHSVAWDADSPPDYGDRAVSNEFTKSGYPLGLMVNVNGERFVDEGIDLRNYTYAKFGKAILQQPDGIAYQIWDKKGSALLRREEYRPEVVRRIEGSSLQELGDQLEKEGLVAKEQLVHTIEEYNEAVYAHRREHSGLTFDPSVKDNLSTKSLTRSLALQKSNWALPLDEPPFLAVKVTCGITFTFGGMAIDSQTAALLSQTTGKAIPGLFCVGEMMGGLFYGNYPGGSGLTSGAVFGRRAGRAAVELALGTASTDERARL